MKNIVNIITTEKIFKHHDKENHSILDFFKKVFIEYKENKFLKEIEKSRRDIKEGRYYKNISIKDIKEGEYFKETKNTEN